MTIAHFFNRGFDPHLLQATDSGIMGLFYSTLIRSNPSTYELEPELAAKWEVPSQTELVFSLAPNIRWHSKPPANGRQLKASDIIYSYQRIRTSDPKYINKGYLSSIDKMEAVDDQTLKLTLKAPDVTQLGNLAVFSLQMLAPEVVEAAKGNLASADTVVGTGAFMLQSSELNVGSSLVRNPNYFKQGLPYLDRVELHAFQDKESEWSAFLAGRLDHDFVPGQDSQKFDAEKQGQYGLGWFGDQTYTLTQAMTRKKPWDDPRVTRAMRLLIDHQEFKQAWGNVWYGRCRYSAIFAGGTADNWDLNEDEYSKYLEWQQPKDAAIKEALTLLAAAGFSKDAPLRFTLSGTNAQPSQQASVTLAQAQLKRNGQGVLDPTIKLYDQASWASVRDKGDFEYYMAGHSSGGIDPDTYFSSTYGTGGGRNYGKMSDPHLDQLIAHQRTIFDEAERKKAVHEIIQYMIDQCPYGSADATYVLNAAQPKVHAFPFGGANFDWGSSYENVWIEH